jgi:hypothetical protein
MMMKKARSTTLALAVLALVAAFVFSRAFVRAPRVERAMLPAPAAPEHLQPAVVDPDLSPPRAGEAVTALYRVFGNTVEMERDAATVGDFNGDGSPDLAVDVRAAEAHTSEINDPLANWTVQNCEVSATAAVAKTPPSPPRVRNREPLLAVIHGFGRRGWRDPEARQSYLLKGTPGGPWLGRSRDRYPGLDAPEARPLGDVLTGSDPAGPIAYWTGARYVCRSAVAARLRAAVRP